MIAAIPLLALIATAPEISQARQSDGQLCQSDAVQVGDERIGWVNLSLDEAGQVIENVLYLSGDNYEATWRIGSPLLRGRGAMIEFTTFLDLPADAAFPVSVTASGDGRRLWSGRFSAQHPTGHGVFVGGEADNPFPNLFGIERLRLVAVDAHGRTIATGVIRFPDWGRVEIGTRSAIRRNERMRRSGGCPPNRLEV